MALRLAVDRDAGRTRVARLDASPFLRPRVVAGRDERVRVALVAASATLLAGDDLRIEVEVGPGAHLELVEPSGTVAYNTRGGSASWSATVHVAEGASLVWAGTPFVAASGCDVHRRTHVELAAGGRMLHHETLVLGRSAEEAGRVRSTMRATYDAVPLLVEDVDLRDPVLRAAPGVLGGRRVLATTALLGVRPDAAVGHETLLAGPGALARAVSDHAHEAESLLAGTWERWRPLVAG